MMNEPGSGFTDDAFLGGKIRLMQPEKGVRAGIDAVFLAAAIPAKGGETLIEAGAGSGAVSLCLCARVSGLKITGIEIQPPAVELARRNVERNHFRDNIKIIEADICAPATELQNRGVAADSYDHVFANPPYFQQGRGRASPLPGKAIAHAHQSGDLARWIRFLIRCLKPGGTLTLIHRPESIGEILPGLEGRAGNIKLAPLFPKPGAPAHRMLVQATKANRAALQILPGLALQDESGRYCSKANAVLRAGEAYQL